MGSSTTGYVVMVVGGGIGVAALFGKLPLWTLVIALPMVFYGSSISGGLGPGASANSTS